MTNAAYSELYPEPEHVQMGSMASYTWKHDPKHMAFTASRYKFVSKMFSGFGDVVEVGCGDGFFSQIVASEVTNLQLVDKDPSFAKEADAAPSLSGLYRTFDGLYALDVLEHVRPVDEAKFLAECVGVLRPHGVAIFGMPSLESQRYASPLSRAGHVNCKTQADFAATMKRYFKNVFMFSMNDEVVHTGFGPMAHYSLALCCGR